LSAVVYPLAYAFDLAEIEVKKLTAPPNIVADAASFFDGVSVPMVSKFYSVFHTLHW
jgi:hypothetical protein